MAVIEVKDGGVNLWGLKVEMQPVLKVAEKIWAKAGIPFVVTSARDGMHSAGSLHYYGYAVDLRTWTDKDSKKQIDMDLRKLIVAELTTALHVIDPRYQVIMHTTHIHIEYDLFVEIA